MLDYSDYIQTWASDEAMQVCLNTRQPANSAETFAATYGVSASGYGMTERLYLGDLTADGGFGQCYWAMKIIFLGKAYREHGSFDFSGLELVQPLRTADGQSDITTATGYQAFCALSEAEQFEHLAIAINPLTGKVYDTFAAPEWAPGAICIEPLTESAERLARGGAVGYYDDVWHVTVYGRAPDSILVDMDIVGRKQMRCIP